MYCLGGVLGFVMDRTLSSPPPLPSSYIEALTLNVTVVWERAFKELIKVKEGHKGEPI